MAALRIPLLALSLVLAGCQTLAPGGAIEVKTPAERLLSGRLSVHYQVFATGKEETVFANFDWAERGGQVDLTLLDPLGQTIAKLLANANAGDATLTLRDGRTFSGPTPESLTRDVLGWTLPVSGLRAWLRGQPANPGNAVVDVDASGARRIREDGWTIVYPGMNPAAPPPTSPPAPLPRRLNLAYPGPEVMLLDLRIVIDSRSDP